MSRQLTRPEKQHAQRGVIWGGGAGSYDVYYAFVEMEEALEGASVFAEPSPGISVMQPMVSPDIESRCWKVLPFFGYPRGRRR